MKKRKEHQWGFMAKTENGELAQCQVELCKKWRIGTGKAFNMTFSEYEEMAKSGQIYAKEVLGC